MTNDYGYLLFRFQLLVLAILGRDIVPAQTCVLQWRRLCLITETPLTIGADPLTSKWIVEPFQTGMECKRIIMLRNYASPNLREAY
jgi:hypothetical protein